MLVNVDPSQTPWYDRFFATWDFDTASELLDAIGGCEFSVDAIARSHDLARRGLSGWLYWTLYIKGFLDARREGGVSDRNVYLDYLVRFGPLHKHDPGIASEVGDVARARSRIERRFHDFELVQRRAIGDPSNGSDLPAIACRVFREPQLDTKELVDSDSGQTFEASTLDGYHRLFLGRLFGLRSVPCLVTYELEKGGS